MPRPLLKPMPFILLASLTIATTALAADTDFDGIDDEVDNCTEFFNPTQLDSDGDLYGNDCDGDLNNDGSVNTLDYYVLAARIGTSDADVDYIRDGIVSSDDLYYWATTLYGVAPGPSGRAASLETPALILDDDDGDGWPEFSIHLDDVDLCPNFYNVDNEDTDGDGIGDACDLCVNLDDSATPGVDTDGDGIGNACDADYNNDGFVNGSDFGPFLSCFTGSGGTTDTACAEVDADGDGFVNSGDYGAFLSQFTAGVPGESGLACADATANAVVCPAYGGLYDTLSDDELGRTVTFLGDIGPKWYDQFEECDEGFDCYLRRSDAWRELRDHAGASVSFVGDVNQDGYEDLLVSSASKGQDSHSRTSRSYLVMGSTEGFSDMHLGDADAEILSWYVSGVYGNSGHLATGAGDFNGDGYDDILLGGPTYNSTGQRSDLNTGAGFIILGSASGISDMNLTEADGIYLGENGGERAGFSVASAGDVNNDGYSDILIGSRAGKAYLVMGGANGPSDMSLASADAVMTTPGYLFNAVSGAGDVNADGFSDVLIGGAIDLDCCSPRAGAYLVMGSDTGIASMELVDADGSMVGEAPNSRAGFALSSAGDVNNDGYDDVLVGDMSESTVGGWAGAAYVVLGSSTGISHISLASADTKLTGEEADDWAGRVVSNAGDVNADGYSDILVGAFNQEREGGAAYIVFGSSDGVESGSLADADVKIRGERYGWSLSGGVDVNQDGFDDVLVGSPYNGHSGAAHLLFGQE